MRLFVGLELEPAVVRTITADVLRLRTELDRSCPAVPVRWIDPANLHITLVFIGEVDDRAVPSTAAALGAPLSHPAFDLQLSGFGTFPPSGPLRVVWIGASHNAERVVALHAEVSDRLARIGHTPEARPYAPHLTVARVKDARGPDARRARDIVRAVETTGASTHVAALTLFRSHLGRRGSTYEPVLRVPLLA